MSERGNGSLPRPIDSHRRAWQRYEALLRLLELEDEDVTFDRWGQVEQIALELREFLKSCPKNDQAAVLYLRIGFQHTLKAPAVAQVAVRAYNAEVDRARANRKKT
jgi:hypothetical protein